MSAVEIWFLVLATAFFGVPTLSYLAVKFGAAGYFRAKRRELEKQQEQNHE